MASQYVRASLLEHMRGYSACFYFATYLKEVQRRVNLEQEVVEMFGENLSFVVCSHAKA